MNEAMTYGLIGSVFGYIVGQGAGTLLSKLGLPGSVTLNYSGTSAMLTMSLILLNVFLIALVLRASPARLLRRVLSVIGKFLLVKSLRKQPSTLTLQAHITGVLSIRMHHMEWGDLITVLSGEASGPG